jgi:aryl-alcohol dehydrogenase-like predicted oxidoreductase
MGTNQFGGKVDQAGVNEIISTAIENGINFFDTADVYQEGRSEEAIGKAIKSKRQDVVIATKFYFKTGEGPNDKGASRKHIFDAVEASLRRLQTDYIDLYQQHRWDDETSIEETLSALDDLISQGKVRYIGSSNFTGWQIAEAQAVSKRNGFHKFITEQPHFHMLERKIKDEVIPSCKYFNIGILPFFPLAGGFLTGKYKEGMPVPEGSRGESSEYVKNLLTADNFKILDSLTKFAKDRNRTISELAHAWLLAQPQISSVISGATKADHVRMNLKAFDWHLSEAEVSEINKLLI